MKKTILNLGVSAAVLSLSAMTALHAESVEPRVAKIMSVSGTAVVERNTHRYTALQGMLLQEGDIVRVLEGGKVNLKYASCSSGVAATMQVTISEANQCATGKVADAADLKAPKSSTSSSKIQRIDPNLAEAACNTCKVQLASSDPTAVTGFSFGTPGKVAAGILGVAGIASAMNGSGGSNAGTTPTATTGGTSTPATSTVPATPTVPVTPTTPVTPPVTGGGASGVPVSPP